MDRADLAYRMGEILISDLWGKLWSFLRVTSKNLLFFSKLVGRVATESRL